MCGWSQPKEEPFRSQGPRRNNVRSICNNVPSSHLHAAPYPNIYLKILYSCVQREAAPPSFLSLLLSLSPLILPLWPCLLCSLPLASLCSLVSSPEVNSSLVVVGPVPSLCIPLPRLMLPRRSAQERGTCPPLSANSPWGSGAISLPFLSDLSCFKGHIQEAVRKSVQSTHGLNRSKENIF